MKHISQIIKDNPKYQKILKEEKRKVKDPFKGWNSNLHIKGKKLK